jgi:F-type H+-transporting ATPase subunit a
MGQQLVFTIFLNRLFGAPVRALLEAVHIHPKHQTAPITDSFAMEFLVAILLTIFFIAVRVRLSVENPGGLQHSMEKIQGFVVNMTDEVIGHHGHKYVPYLVTLGVFILSCNLIGLVPGLESPTAVPVVPLGCALLTWFYYQYHGVKTNGPLGYLKHFMGPQDKEMPFVMRLLLPILMFPIEIFSHLARVLSLTTRLCANMFAGEMVTLVFFSLIPLGVPVLFEGLHIGVSLIQTYIFVLLACVYLAEATGQEH